MEKNGILFIFMILKEELNNKHISFQHGYHEIGRASFKEETKRRKQY